MSFDIEGWVYRTFDNVTTSNSGNDVVVDCPFCAGRVGKTSASHHLSISLYKETCHCYRCDYRASWLGLVMAVDNVGMQAARHELGTARSDIQPLYMLRRGERDPRRASVLTMPSDFVTLADSLHGNTLARRLGSHACKYLETRVSRTKYDRLIMQWGIFANRDGYGKLVMPVENGWWQCRQIFDNSVGPKYMSCLSPKESRLYNYPILEHARHVGIAEGIISAECMDMPSVALCGKTATPQQIRRLCTARVKTYSLCLDAGTRDETIRLAQSLLDYGKRVAVRVYASGDPASSSTYHEAEFTWHERIRMSLQMQ